MAKTKRVNTAKEEKPILEEPHDGTDGKVTMVRDGKGRRFHASEIFARELEGWELVQ